MKVTLALAGERGRIARHEGRWYELKRGEPIDVPDDLADSLIEQGIVEAVTGAYSPPAPQPAEPDEPEGE